MPAQSTVEAKPKETRISPVLTPDLLKALTSVRSSLDLILDVLPDRRPATTSVKPVTLEDNHRQKIEEICGGTIINTADDVVNAFLKYSALTVEGFAEPLVIPHDYLVRMESRCPIDTDLALWIKTEFLRFCELLVDGAL